MCESLSLCHAALGCVTGLCEVKRSDTMEVSEIGDSSLWVCVYIHVHFCITHLQNLRRNNLCVCVCGLSLYHVMCERFWAHSVFTKWPTFLELFACGSGDFVTVISSSQSHLLISFVQSHRLSHLSNRSLGLVGRPSSALRWLLLGMYLWLVCHFKYENSLHLVVQIAQGPRNSDF